MEKIIELKINNEPTGVWLVKADLNELIEQDVNPRTMSREMFNQLKENIKKRGGLLESLPYCAKTDKGIEIVSGHHRIRTVRAAELTEALILLDDSGLSRDEIIAKQLAHNSIAGYDNEQLVLQLYSQIKDVDCKIETFINAEELKKLIPESVRVDDFDVGLIFHNINMLFLPNQLENFEEVLTVINKEDKGVCVADLKHWDKFKEAVNKTRGVENIKSVGMTIAKMCDIVLEHYKKEDKKDD